MAADQDLLAFVGWMHEQGLAQATVTHRHRVLQRVSTYLGKPLREASESDLLRWKAFAIRGRTAGTERGYVRAVRAFYAWAVARGRTAANPAADFRPTTAGEVVLRERVRRDAELDEVERFFQQHPRAGLDRPKLSVNDLGVIRTWPFTYQ